MKNLFILLLALSIGLAGFSQKRAIVPQHLKDYAVEKQAPMLEFNQFVKNYNPLVKSTGFIPEEEQIGLTRYDDQSNASIQNRIYLYEDGTIGAIWIIGMYETAFADRGTGYNYYDGNNWGALPAERVEDERCGWPSYAPLGENGEIVVAHTSGDGLKISTRTDKGTGDWSYSTFNGPPDHEYLVWNRTITSGIDHNRVHILGLTAPVAYGGTIYEGLDGALVYSLSTDEGVTWDMENEILDGMTSNEYCAFTSDNYTWAEPKGDIVAFVVGETWYDMFLMKSTDGGETFEKTLIWENPYPFWQSGTATDTFYCADGAHSIIIDDNDIIHVVFGINRAYADDAGSSYWYPYVDGIGYWNETMPSFSDDLNALNPYGHPDSELIEDYNLIGWTQDVNNNGQIDLLDEIGTYYLGLSSMPQLVLGDNNQLFLIFSSATETYDNGTTNYRHLWARASLDCGATWGEFLDLTSDLIHIFDECVYASCAANSDDYIHLVYQVDNEPGNAVWAGQHPYVDNKITYMRVLKAEITGMKENREIIYDYDVSQNYPNPFNTTSVVDVNIRKTTELCLEIVNLMGQNVFKVNAGVVQPGMNKITIDASVLTPGIYFYTVKAGESSVTKKMIVE